jgi:Cytochrome c7 and related cytochrome c
VSEAIGGVFVKRIGNVMMLAAAATVALLLIASLLSAQQTPPPAPKQLVPANLGNHPAPAQPLPYSHKTHLAVGLQCKLCHTNPDPGKLMTFPGASVCMTCHVSIAKDKPAIRQLADFAKSGKPIPWVRVYAVTPGVTWTHRKHVEAGLKCDTCHGQVSQMEAMSETTSVTAMAVCINCHIQNKAATTCQTCHVWPANQNAP